MVGEAAPPNPRTIKLLVDEKLHLEQPNKVHNVIWTEEVMDAVPTNPKWHPLARAEGSPRLKVRDPQSKSRKQKLRG